MTTVYPITYIEVMIFFIYVTYDHVDYWIRAISRLFAAILSIYIAITAYGGETWLFISDTNVFTLSQFNDGFAQVISLSILGVGLLLLIVTGFSIAGHEWSNDGATHTQTNNAMNYAFILILFASLIFAPSIA